MLSGSSVEPDSTSGIKPSTKNPRGEKPTLGPRERPFYPLLEGVGERSERGGVWTQCVGQVAHFNLTPETSLC